MRVHANCSSVAPLEGSKRSIEAIRASRPHEMKSSTSQRAGSSRTFLKTMYFTSGAKVMTRRLRTRTSPVRLYSCHSLRASSGDTRRRLEVVVVLMDEAAPTKAELTDSAFIGPSPQPLHHPFGVIVLIQSE